MGFKKNPSTTLAIFNFIKHIMESLKTRKYVICIFLDLRKAFDSVNHKILLKNLFRIRFRGNIHSLISSYLKIEANMLNLMNINLLIAGYLMEFHKVPHLDHYYLIYFLTMLPA